MKNFFYIGSVLLAIALAIAAIAFIGIRMAGGATVVFPYQGGTGTSTVPKAGDILMGDGTLRYAPTRLTAGTDITISTTTADTGTSEIIITSTASAGTGDPFAWTAAPEIGGVSTSTTLGFYNGFVATASSTISGLSTDTSTTTNFVLGSQLFTSLTGTGLQLSGTTLATDDANIDHDSLQNFVANEHIDHTSVTLTAGNGLSGGGDISTNRTFNADFFPALLGTLGDVATSSVAVSEILGWNGTSWTNFSTSTYITEGEIGSGLTFGGGTLDADFQTAGRSLTLSANAVDADSELFTETATANLHATSSNQLATSTNVWLSKRFPQAATITSVDCFAQDVGTSTIQAEIRTSAIAAGSDILYQTGLNCGADEEVASSTLQNTAISTGDWITVDVPDAEPTGSRPRAVFFSLTWTYND